MKAGLRGRVYKGGFTRAGLQGRVYEMLNIILGYLLTRPYDLCRYVDVYLYLCGYLVFGGLVLQLCSQQVYSNVNCCMYSALLYFACRTINN
ncbi:hypothetical protein NIES4071_16220 [Calothrix sp. NIES-4071]|nr:hypothetical protein NIES4071_16220 [Calothrix sp. NIES-4071]BAZ55956.1 hypothetical protein NIES4105_16170 [Calothrix sp. NIES-4105]